MVLPQKMARTSQTVKHLHNQFLDLRKTDALTSDAINLQTKSFVAIVVLSDWRPVTVGSSQDNGQLGNIDIRKAVNAETANASLLGDNTTSVFIHNVLICFTNILPLTHRSIKAHRTAPEGSVSQ